MTYSVLGIDTQTGQRVEVPKLSRLQGLYIIGIPGTGKTGLIESLIIQDIKQGMGVGLLDPHGDLTQAVLSRVPESRVNDVIYVDIGDEDYPFGLNLFECSNPNSTKAVQIVVDQVMHVFEKLFDVSRQTPRMAQYLRNCTHTLIANPSYTMAEIPLLLENEQCRKRLVANVTNPQSRLFWNQYDRMRPQERYEEARSTLNKLDEFLQGLTFNIIAQSKTTISFRDVMDEGKILLVKLDATLASVTSLVGSVIIAQLLNAAYSRPVNKRRQFNLYADEFQRFATEDFATLLTEARKFGITTTIAHQARYQPGMTDGIRATSLGAANLVVFRVQPQDATELAGKFERTPPPPAVDWLEESVGVKTVKAYKRDVIGHLLWQGHEDERTVAFVRDYLRELHFALPKRIKEERQEEFLEYGQGGSSHVMGEYAHNISRMPSRYGTTVRWSETVYPRNHLGIEYDPEEIPRVLAELNTWLFEGMRDQDALWQPLPGSTLGFLAHFFDFEPIYTVFYKPQQSSLGEFQTEGFLAREAQDSGISQDQLFHAAISAIEAAFVEFLCSVFPSCSKAGIQESWRQSGLAIADSSFTASRLLAQAAVSYHQIITTLLADTKQQPYLDAAGYMRRFLAELSNPRLAIEIFLPILSASYKGIGSYLGFEGDHWRTVREIGTKLSYEPHRILQPKIGFVTVSGYRPQMALWYTYHLEQFIDSISLALIEEMQRYLEPFLTFLRFFALLHCAQLALSQRPLETMGSGHYEPDIRRHPVITQRSYPEMVSLIANELTNLPLYTARVKITADGQGVEHTVKTLDPKQQSEKPLFGHTLQARLECIKAQNIQDGYLRERTEVEAEIRQRQEQCSQPPGDEPPISRHPQH